MTLPERVLNLCAKLATASSGPEFERVSCDLLSAIDEYTRSRIAECVHEIYAAKDADKKLALVEELKQMLDDQQRNSARA